MFFEKRVDRIFDLAERVEEAFSSAGRNTGSLAAWRLISTWKNWSPMPAA
jgi:hypothetical protein